jgi:hypothetical protein
MNETDQEIIYIELKVPSTELKINQAFLLIFINYIILILIRVRYSTFKISRVNGRVENDI